MHIFISIWLPCHLQISYSLKALCFFCRYFSSYQLYFLSLSLLFGRFFNFQMDNDQHKIHLESSLLDMFKLIDSLRILPKNRLLLYQRYVLSKLSWHLTVANLSKTWVIENLDNVVVRFVRKWLDLPISATLGGISLPRNQFGLNLLLPSVNSYNVKLSYAQL